MRTRNQSKLNKEDPTGDSSTHSNSAAKSHDEEGKFQVRLLKPQKEGVGKLLHRAKSRRGRKECRPSDEMNEKSPRENGELNKEHIPDFGLKGYVSGNVAKSSSNISRGVEGSVHCDANEMDWEEGTISASEFREDYSHEHGREVTVEFTDSPSSAQKKLSRRASAEEKVNYTKSGIGGACAQGSFTMSTGKGEASILSLLPSYLLKIMEIPRLKANMLGSLVHWFHENFHIRSKSIDTGSFHSNLSHALEAREGTAEEVAALSVALFHALNLRTQHSTGTTDRAIYLDSYFIYVAYDEEEERRESEERKRNEAQALSRWFQLLSSIVTRQRLQNSYVDSSPLHMPKDAHPSSQNNKDGTQSNSLEGDKLSRGTPGQKRTRQ